MMKRFIFALVLIATMIFVSAGAIAQDMVNLYIRSNMLTWTLTALQRETV